MSVRRVGMNSPSVHDLIERFNNKEPLATVFDDVSESNAVEVAEETSCDSNAANNITLDEIEFTEKESTNSVVPPEKPQKPRVSRDNTTNKIDVTITEKTSLVPPEKPKKLVKTPIPAAMPEDDQITPISVLPDKEQHPHDSDNRSKSTSESTAAVMPEDDQITPISVLPDKEQHPHDSDNRSKSTTESTEATNEIKLKNQTQRGYIIAEIIETERNYLNNLKIVLGVFLNPLREQEILSLEEIIMQFKNWENLVKVHEIFYDDLVKESEPSLAMISKLFIDISKFFKIYEAYLVNYELAQKNRAKLLIKNKKYAELIDKGMAHPLNPRGYSLETLLIEPVQRLPRYRLLLQQLKKYSVNDSEIKWEHGNVCRALETMEKIASEANEAIRKSENKTKIMEIMNRMSFQTRVDLADVDGRMFIKEGLLHRQCRRVVKPFNFWLFSDLLIYGEQVILSTAVADAIGSLPTYNINRTINLNACKIISANDSYANCENAFIVQSPQKSFVVWAASPSERQEWMNGIQGAQTALQSVDINTVAIAPIWTPDRHAPHCSVCNAAFSVLKRRHHCRSCGSIVCDNCSKKRYLLAHVDKNNLVRVCDTCYDKYVTIAGGSSKSNSDSSPSTDSTIQRIGGNVSAVGGAVKRRSLAAMTAVNDIISPVLRQFSNGDNASESSESNSGTPNSEGGGSNVVPRRSITQMIGHLLGTDDDVPGAQQQAAIVLDSHEFD